MTVTVFTNPNNPQCEATEQELSKLGVRYVAVDFKKATLGLIQNFLASGMKKFPLIQTLIFSVIPAFLFSFKKEALILSSFRLPINFL